MDEGPLLQLIMKPGTKRIFMKHRNVYETSIFMAPTLKKLMGHIAFGASVSGCVRASHFLYLL